MEQILDLDLLTRSLEGGGGSVTSKLLFLLLLLHLFRISLFVVFNLYGKRLLVTETLSLGFEWEEFIVILCFWFHSFCSYSSWIFGLRVKRGSGFGISIV